jgi:hypothetical protein
MALRELPMAGGVVPAGEPGYRVREVVTSVLFVGSGFVALLAGSVLLLLWGPGIAAPGGWASPHALGLTHVLALGFISSVAIGVLYHLTPRIFGTQLRRPAAGAVIWVVYLAGVAALAGGLATGRSGWAAAGGAALAVAILAVAAHLGTAVVGTRRRHLPGVYAVAALVALLCVAGLGAALALMLHYGAPPSFLSILAAKVTLAIGGWLGVLVVGVSYQLVPMFTTTPVRARFMKEVLGLVAAGAVLAAVACLTGAPVGVRVAAALPYAAGILLHVADVGRMVRGRRVRRPGPITVGQVAGGLLLLAGTVEGVAAMGGDGPWPQLAVVTALVGWAPLLIAANGVRIVPFILWQGLPAGRRPRTFAPAPDALGWTGIAAASATWILITVAFAANSGGVARLAGAALVVCAAAVAGIGLGSLRSARRIRRAA